MPPPVAEPTHGPALFAGTDPTEVPFTQRLQELLETSSDPTRVEHYVREFSTRNPAQWEALTKQPEQLRWLTLIFGSSRFLSEELLRNPDWIFSVHEVHSAFSTGHYELALSQTLRARGVAIPAALDFALFRRQQLLRIALRDRMHFGTLAEITEELSNLADAILGSALQAVTAEVESRFGSPMAENGGGRAGFAVLALGKLGGRELNYSSDVDLMFIYSDNGETSGENKITNREFFKKVANQFTHLLSTYTAAGLCYRVDLRLRPEGSLGEVCISLAAAKEYYGKRARDWELQMLLKARAVAGDEKLGQELLDFVEPLIYSTSLDFSTIETMSATRERITEKLASKRLRKDELDVKLARGGIRDIEFLVQCLQRLHGGRDTWVRNAGTLMALTRLHEKDLLSSTEYSRLAHAYQFLRNLEHLLQYEDDRQTHALPTNPAELAVIARRMFQSSTGDAPDVSASAQLLKELNHHLENVQAIYERIVYAQRPLYYGLPSSSEPASLEMRAVREEPHPPLADDLLRVAEKLTPQLAERLRVRGILRSEAKLACFLASLPTDSPELQLLNAHPVVADWLIRVFETSPYLTEQLMRAPELLEEIRRAADHPTRRWAFEGLAAPLNDIDGLRRFFSREMFRILVAGICLPEPVFQTLDNTSALAEFMIARAYRIALERGLAHARSHTTKQKPFQDPQSEMMVVALGRLGMREFDLASDADLLFIIPDSESQSQRFWTRVTEHLIEILTAYSANGTFLSIDTRLRPNGREGVLVQTESTYVDYFSSKAEAWEGIAYMKARAVAGDTDRATAFLNELQQVDWRRYGQSGRSKQDLRQMRLRLQREQGSTTPVKAAEGGYYDADFILMYLRLKGAGMFYKSLNTPERIDIVEKMGHLDREDAEFLLEATTFFRALDHAIRIVTGRAEGKIPAAGEQREMIAELLTRWTARSVRPASLDDDLFLLQTKTRRLFDSIFKQ
jgi:glutamate-ammonia-ligase adenylyltransferase